MANLFDFFNENAPDNPYYDDGTITVGDVSIDTGLGSQPDNDFDPYWSNLGDFVGAPDDGTDASGEDNLYVLDDFRSDSAIPWSWILGGGVVLVLFYAARR